MFVVARVSFGVNDADKKEVNELAISYSAELYSLDIRLLRLSWE